MARIAFCWELGRGLGHIVPHLDLIRRLVARGDEVVFLAQDPARVESVFRHENFTVCPLAHGHTPVADRMRNADSFPQVLFNSGFHDADVVHARLLEVLATLERAAPDILVCDYAPTVMLANHVARRPLVLSGYGFWNPPRSVPMPRFRYWLGPPAESFVEREATVLAVINDAGRRIGIAPFGTFAEFFTADRLWLCTYEELDSYAGRADGHYLGMFTDHDFGTPPQWPNAHGLKVFAYLTPGRTGLAALAALAAQPVSVCLYAPRLADAEAKNLPPGMFHRCTTPVSLPAVARECHAFVNNGNLSTATVALLAGRPQLCLPESAEQYLNARRIELLGAGLAAPQRDPGHIAGKLQAILHEPDYARAAGRFARKYAARRLGDRTEYMLADLDTWC